MATAKKRLKKSRWIVSLEGGSTSVLKVIDRGRVAVSRAFRLKTDKNDPRQGKIVALGRMEKYLEIYHETGQRAVDTEYAGRPAHRIFEVVRPTSLRPGELKLWNEVILPKLNGERIGQRKKAE